MKLGNLKEAERRFYDYYRELVGDFDRSPPIPSPLLRHLEYLLRRDTRLHEDAGKVAEDLIQELVLQPLRYITEDRPAAAKYVRETASTLDLLSRGELFQHQTKQWVQNFISLD